MAVEIERKFLVQGDAWRSLGQGVCYRQGYIATVGDQTVRVRVADNAGYLTLKGPTVGNARLEFEYPIPLAEAMQLLDDLCDRPLIEKTRYTISVADVVWEVDEFHGDNQGLILAEVELADEQQQIDLPGWIGQEVSGDRRYYNTSLVNHPFTQWADAGSEVPS
ncbi:adenylate cyclase [Neosynechococcus sphagnicola sy1]|uniref:Adenylate cyclase n=1 Tax=Neosynechococcus sphagnicola sy1 TaxID=1497020 RepID=A0A098TI62_9CYAN|nr:CYTH domain-containing protein [Neosynechococcus sphagnicola]KGF71799.1 adenylate cyclase [Neosynechococcus sphagnicola sy1]